MIAALPVLILSGVIALAARRSVRQLSGGQDDMPLIWAFIPAALGGWALLLSAPADPLSATGMIYGATGCFMMALAAFDWKTAWAPDVLTFPLMGLAGSLSALSAGTHPLVGAALGIGIMIALQLVYAIISTRLAVLPPPPDLMAFALGPLLLGVGVALGMSLIAITLILLAVRFMPGARQRLEKSEAMQAAAGDLGYEPHMGPAIPLLAVVMPVLVALLCLSLIYPAFFY